MVKRRVTSKAGKKPAAKKRRSSKDNGDGRVSRRKIAVPSTAVAKPAAAEQEEQPMPKSRLKPDDLDAFKRLLLEKRNQLVGDVGHLTDEALKRNRSDACGDLSMMPIHMADIGTDAYEQEFTIGLIENEQEIMKEIDAALQRIENGTYGICEATHKPIKKARLKAKPWARYCVTYKRSQEENRR